VVPYLERPNLYDGVKVDNSSNFLSFFFQWAVGAWSFTSNSGY
jgi:hypothetical protein